MTTKIKSGVIAAGAVDASALSDNSITIAHLNCSDGTNGQVLSTDGSGTLSFTDMVGGVDGIVSSADATAITIDSSENVGIGISSPGNYANDDNSLAVLGQVRIQGVTNTAAVPILALRDNNSGLFAPAANTIAISTGTAERMRIDSSGNVGIGTDNPTVNLDVYNGSGWGGLDIDGTSGGEIRLQKAGTRYGGIYANDSTGLVILAENGADSTLFYTGGSLRMTINSSGNVGIGTSPSERLHILGGGSGPEIRLENSSGSHYIRAYDNNWNFLANATNTAMTIRNNGQAEFGAYGVAMGDTDGDYTHRGATGGLHVKRGGILMNGPPGDANMSSATNGNQWTYFGQGGRGGSFTSLTISVPNCNNGASGVGYGGFSLEFYIAGYNAKYHSGHFSGYVNASITISKRAFWDSSGSGTLSSGSVGAQGFYLTIGFPSMTHPTCKFVINKGGHGGSTGNAAWTDMDGVSVTWA